MLDELLVQNLGIIGAARFEPGPGLVVVTGETGAGKTLLLGALRLLLGDTARADGVGPAGPEALVEGRFVDADGNELVVGRRVAREGRSRAYLDGSMATARAIAERTESLAEIVAQHEHLALTQSSEIRGLLDRNLDEAGVKARQAYLSAHERFDALERDARALGGDRKALERELDLVAHQVTEIGAAGFEPGEDAELTTEAGRLRHASELLDHLHGAHDAAERAADLFGASVAAVRKAATLDSGLAVLAEEVEGVAASLGEAVSGTRAGAEAIVVDPERLSLVEERLALLGDLRRKYGDTLEDVLDFAKQASRRHDELRSLLGRAERLAEELHDARRAVVERGADLREARRAAGVRLATEAQRHLVELGFSTPVVEIDVGAGDPGPHGADTVGVAFASDERLQPGPVGRIASGGELSRLVLALQLAGGAGRAPIVAFDEIDAGVGGRTALALGRKLATLAADRQVLCVTHLPQVAAFADRHVVVERADTDATVRIVDGEERVEELSRMLAGLADSDPGRRHAEELLRQAGRMP